MAWTRHNPNTNVQELVGGNISTFAYGTNTLAQLGSAATAGNGARAYITDASAALASATVGTTVTGGGANSTPVYSDGTNWKFG